MAHRSSTSTAIAPDATTPTPSLSGGSRVARRSNVPWKELDGIAIILLLDTGDYFELDGLGLDLWKMLDGSRTLDECAEAITRTHDAPLDVVRADVLQFADDLLAGHLASIVEA